MLPDYSYLLIRSQKDDGSVSPSLWKDPSEPKAGTAFFVRRKNTIFLCTARHLLTSYNPYKKTDDPDSPEYLFVRYFDRNGKVKYQKIPFNHPDHRSTSPLWIDTDVGSVDVTQLFLDADLNIIDNNLLRDGDKFQNKDGNEIITFGYSKDLGKDFKTIQTFLADVQPKLISGFVTGDTITHEFKLQMNSKYYYVSPFMQEGMSGSPVFGAVRNGENQTYVLIGVVSGGSKISNGGFITKIANLKF